MPITLRPDLADLEPYDPDMRPARVVLTANENNYGLPADARARIAERLAQVELNRYPDATSPELRRALGQMWGVPARDIVVGNGGDEIIFNVLLAFGGPGRALVNVPPTFSAYALYAQLTQTRRVDVPRDGSYDVDEQAVLDAAQEAGAGVTIICSPNNPTGNVVSPAFIERLAQAAPNMLIMVDEAYGEFADPATSCVPLMERHDNVCVLRTLSKAFALAGARVGYLIAPPAVADGMLAVRLPYSVNRLSQAAAQVALESRSQIVQVTQAIREERTRLAGLLQTVANDLEDANSDISISIYPSQANFMLVRFEREGAPDIELGHALHEQLAADGVLVRDFAGTPGCEGGLRISVGMPQENDEFVRALRAHLGLD